MCSTTTLFYFNPTTSRLSLQYIYHSHHHTNNQIRVQVAWYPTHFEKPGLTRWVNHYLVERSKKIKIKKYINILVKN
jgi:hypothetical protein